MTPNYVIDLSTHGHQHPAIKLSIGPKALVSPDKASPRILVVGGGVSGLMTAWILLDKGYRVTILAKEWAWTRDWQHSRLTSQIAGALWEYPPGGCGLTEIESPAPGFADLKNYQEWALESLEFYTKLNVMLNGQLRTEFGVSITALNQFFYHSMKPTNGADYGKFVDIQKACENKRMDGFINYPDHESLQNLFDGLGVEQEWQRNLQSGYAHDTAIIDTDKAMNFLMTLVRNKGAEFETKEFDGKQPLTDLAGDLKIRYNSVAIINATGLGAKELAPDEDVYPVRGAIKRIRNDNSGAFQSLSQAYLIPAQHDDDGQQTKVVFLVPRNHETLIVGSIIQPNNDQLNLVESSPEVEAMWKTARSFLPSLNDAGTLPWYPLAQGLRPFTRNNAKVRAADAEIPVIHNYGHGGSGWTLAVGCARSAVYLLELMLQPNATAARANEEVYPERS